MIWYALGAFFSTFAPPVPAAYVGLAAAALPQVRQAFEGRRPDLLSPVFGAGSVLHPADEKKLAKPALATANDRWDRFAIDGAPIAAIGARDQEVAAAGITGLWRSKDRGSRWARDHRVDPELQRCTKMALAFHGRDLVFRCTQADEGQYCRLLPANGNAALPCRAGLPRNLAEPERGPDSRERAVITQAADKLGLQADKKASLLRAASASGARYLAHARMGVYRSLDDGGTWSFQSSGVRGLIPTRMRISRSGRARALKVEMAAPSPRPWEARTRTLERAGDLFCAPDGVLSIWRCSWVSSKGTLGSTPAGTAMAQAVHPDTYPASLRTIVPASIPGECRVFDLWPGGPASILAATSCGLLGKAHAQATGAPSPAHRGARAPATKKSASALAGLNPSGASAQPWRKSRR